MKFGFKKLDLTDAQWEQLAPVFETPYKGTGRPRQDARTVLNGILWILRTGAPWKDLLERYPPYQTCHRRYQAWVDEGIFDLALQTLAQDLYERGQIDVKECSIDGFLRSVKKRGSGVGKIKRGKGSKIIAIADTSGFPIAITTNSASPHEVTLVEQTLEAVFIAEFPEKLIGDKAYDSDPLDQKMYTDFGFAMIAPHRSNRTKPKTQDGRKLRRYCRRWKVERLFAWIQNFRRCIVRHEYYQINFEAF